MDVSEVTAAVPLTVSRINPDERRERRSGADPSGRSLSQHFTLPFDNAFDSAAPVAVDAATEAAVVDLKPIDGLPLAEAIHRYVDED